MYIFTCHWIYPNIFETDPLANLVHSMPNSFVQGFCPLHLQKCTMLSAAGLHFLVGFFSVADRFAFFVGRRAVVLPLFSPFVQRHQCGRHSLVLRLLFVPHSHIVCTCLLCCRREFVWFCCLTRHGIHIDSSSSTSIEKNAFVRKLRACRHTHAPSSSLHSHFSFNNRRGCCCCIAQIQYNAINCIWIIHPGWTMNRHAFFLLLYHYIAYVCAV